MTSAPPPTGEQPAEDRASAAGPTATFLMAVAQEIGGADLTPTALCHALVRVLPVDAAGLSTMANVLRLPLGASNEDAVRAEELQSSLGEGPCLDAAEAQAAVTADLADLQVRWPLYAQELSSTTPFRAVVAVPLSMPGSGVFAALDLYSADPRLGERLDLRDVDEVALTVAALLITCIARICDVDAPEDGPDWYREAASRRHDVWVAIGMVMACRADRRTGDVLSLLRAHAFAQNRSLDDLAVAIVDGRLDLAGLTD